jgi:hypothetical protein
MKKPSVAALLFLVAIFTLANPPRAQEEPPETYTTLATVKCATGVASVVIMEREGWRFLHLRAMDEHGLNALVLRMDHEETVKLAKALNAAVERIEAAKGPAK